MQTDMTITNLVELLSASNVSRIELSRRPSGGWLAVAHTGDDAHVVFTRFGGPVDAIQGACREAREAAR